MRAFDTGLLDLIEHPVFVLEPGGNGDPVYAAFNACARGVLNKKSSEIVGRTAAEVYEGRFGELALSHHREAFRSGQPQSYEILLPMRGATRRVNTTLRPILDSSGAVAQVFGSSKDISSAQMLREMQVEVDTINSEMEDFINIAGHDPSVSVMQLKQLMAMLRSDFKDLGDGKFELVEVLGKISEKSTNLIATVLSNADAASSLDLDVKFQFGDLVDEVIALLDPMNHLKVEYSGGLVLGDRTAMGIALQNVVQNAQMNRGQSTLGQDAKLGLQIQLTCAEDGFIAISVQDNLPDLPRPTRNCAQDQKHAADKDCRIRDVERLVRARRGKITQARRSDGVGRQVSFTLPGSVEPV